MKSIFHLQLNLNWIAINGAMVYFTINVLIIQLTQSSVFFFALIQIRSNTNIALWEKALEELSLAPRRYLTGFFIKKSFGNCGERLLASMFWICSNSITYCQPLWKHIWLSTAVRVGGKPSKHDLNLRFCIFIIFILTFYLNWGFSLLNEMKLII